MKSKIIISGILAFSNPAAAITVHQVKSLADHGPNTLRAAVAAAVSGDRITFAPWLYNKAIRLDSEIVINKNLRIEGDINGDRRPDVTLDGQHKTRLLNVAVGANVTLWGLVLARGNTNVGGAIYNQGTLSIEFCHVAGNEAWGRGGAIYNRGTLSIDSSSVRDNTAATDGGAIYNGKVQNSDAATLTITASTLAWNRAKETGGAVYNEVGTFRAYASTFSDNAAQKSVDYRNHQENKGSVLYANGGTNEFFDSTLKNNRSSPLTDPEQEMCGNHCGLRSEQRARNVKRRTTNGGTIYNLGSARRVKLTRTVVSGSRGRNCGGWGGYTMINSWSDDNTCSDMHYFGTNRGDPKLGPLADNGGYTYTHKPRDGSGLIDAAGTVCLNRDQRGARRTRYPDTHCDIGAVETNAQPPSRLRPQSINTTPPAEHNEDIAALNSRIETLQTLAASTQAAVVERETTIASLQGQLGTLRGQLTTLQGQLAVAVEGSQEAARLRRQITEKEAQIARKESEIAEHRARIAELEAPDELEVGIGDAGEIEGLRLNGNNVLHDSETRVKVGSETFNFADTLTNSPHERSDGSIVSGGQFQGENGVIYWTITSTVVPRTNFHVSRWEFSSRKAFGDMAISVYADLDIGQYTGHNGLIVGGTGHPNRLLITDRTNPKEGVALGLRALKNASRMGWVGSPDIYHGRNGEVLDASILTGAYSGWGQFTPDAARYSGAHGYGPADIAVAMGVKLKPSAKLASFETTLVGAPNGYIE
ncbi:choice-of-anchor Q domain-containing protein [Thiolapillus sp.]|uniref:choice-of-anchor Q domain-containing protein n=1 Tax=Thiolapillus sp. TaxID=2017437 RepID=UPI0025F7E3BA|nr:choice-of-anchor Q domain-containing protein [Thiolapillus sp.]